MMAGNRSGLSAVAHRDAGAVARGSGQCWRFPLAMLVLLTIVAGSSGAAPPAAAPASDSPASGAAPSRDWSSVIGTPQSDRARGALGPAPGNPPQASAPPSQSAPAPAPPAASEYAKVPLQRQKPVDGEAASGGAAASSGAGDLLRVAAALAVVIGLIFLLRWGGRRFFSLPSANASNRAVQVLSRSAISPRQAVVVLQVGRRLLVAAEGASGMTTLCEITDADEIASLIGQVRAEKETSPTHSFTGLFGRVRRRFAVDAGDSGDGDADEEAGRAASTARSPFGLFRNRAAGDVGAAEVEADDDAEDDDRAADTYDHVEVEEGRRPSPPRGESEFDGSEADAAVASARHELTGLREKLRMVSRHFPSASEPAKPGGGGSIAEALASAAFDREREPRER